MPRRPKPESDPASPVAAPIPRKKSILIVEDSEDFRNLLKLVIEDEGFEGVLFPVHKEEIVPFAQEHAPALILMDLALRRKGGMEFINDLKADSSTKDIPIIVLTGRDLSQREVLELEVKGVKYLRKGRVEMFEIKAAIKAAVYRG
jgi:two-component system phosphate regulon response regulator PhoB